jgi:hypothetical protein
MGTQVAQRLYDKADERKEMTDTLREARELALRMVQCAISGIPFKDEADMQSQIDFVVPQFVAALQSAYDRGVQDGRAAATKAERERCAAEARDLLSEFERIADKAWMPMQVFRTNEEVAADEARHEVWTDATELVRKSTQAILTEDQPNER